MVYADLLGKYFHPAFCVSVRYLIKNAGKYMYLLTYFLHFCSQSDIKWNSES